MISSMDTDQCKIDGKLLQRVLSFRKIIDSMAAERKQVKMSCSNMVPSPLTDVRGHVTPYGAS